MSYLSNPMMSWCNRKTLNYDVISGPVSYLLSYRFTYDITATGICDFSISTDESHMSHFYFMTSLIQKLVTFESEKNEIKITVEYIT